MRLKDGVRLNCGRVSYPHNMYILAKCGSGPLRSTYLMINGLKSSWDRVAALVKGVNMYTII